MTRLDTDILIIGSGAAGGVLAATLSELTPKRVTLVEKGAYFAREFFNQRFGKNADQLVLRLGRI